MSGHINAIVLLNSSISLLLEENFEEAKRYLEESFEEIVRAGIFVSYLMMEETGTNTPYQ